MIILLGMVASAIFAIALCVKHGYQTGQRWSAQDAARQQYWVAQQPAAPPVPPVAHTVRTERAVRVVHAPAPQRKPAAPTATPVVRSALTIVSGHVRPPVRHSEDHGGFTVDDRRVFDPDLEG